MVNIVKQDSRLLRFPLTADLAKAKVQGATAACSSSNGLANLKSHPNKQR